MHSYAVKLQTLRPVKGEKQFYYEGVVAKNSRHAVNRATSKLMETTRNKVVISNYETRQLY